jgi:hypothetical protein
MRQSDCGGQRRLRRERRELRYAWTGERRSHEKLRGTELFVYWSECGSYGPPGPPLLASAIGAAAAKAASASARTNARR